MDCCFLCLEISNDVVGSIKINSALWYELEIPNLIHLHLWPMEMEQISSWLCSTCCQELHDFHKFYTRVRAAQNSQIESMVKMEIEPEVTLLQETQVLSMEEDLTMSETLSQDLIIEQDLSSEELQLSEDDTPLMQMDKIRVSTTTNSGGETTIEDPLNLPTKINKLLKAFIGESNNEDSINFKTDTKIDKIGMSTPRSPACETTIEDYVSEDDLIIEQDESSLELDYVSEDDTPFIQMDKIGVSTTTNSAGETTKEDPLNVPTKLNKILKAFIGESNKEDSDNDSKPVTRIKLKSRHKRIKDEDSMKADNFIAENFEITCSICQNSFETFHDMCKHFKKEHEQTGYVICCGKKILRRKLLLEHLQLHMDPNYFKCNICGQKLANRRTLTSHIKMHGTRERKHCCDICGLKFLKRYTLANHKTVHLSEEEKLFPCPKCGKNFGNKVVLGSHIRSHSRINCSLCGKKFKNRAVLNRHKRVMHPAAKYRLRMNEINQVNTTKNSEADIVQAETSMIEALSQDLTIEQDMILEEQKSDKPLDEAKNISQMSATTKLPDEIVNNETDNIENSLNLPKKLNKTPKPLIQEYSNNEDSDLDSNCLADTERTTASSLSKSQEYNRKADIFIAENFKITCSICQISFETFYELCNHFKTEHEQPGYVICCDKPFFQRRLLLEHVHQHVDPNYLKCNKCGKKLSTKACLQLHMKMHNPREKNYCCDICGKSFLRGWELRNHKTRHLPEEEKQFPCSNCGKRFGNSIILAAHIARVHVVVYCEICGKSLANNSVLNRHKLIVHPDGKSEEFTCTICSKVLRHKHALRTHVKKVHHTGYDFQCTMCNKAYKIARKLKDHMATHTNTYLYTCSYCPEKFMTSDTMQAHRRNLHAREWKQEKHNNKRKSTLNNNST